MKQNFAFLHFLNAPGQPGCFTVDRTGIEWVENVAEAVKEMTRRETTGEARFVEINHFLSRAKQPAVGCKVHEGAFARLYPLTREPSYQHPEHRGLDCEHPVYILHHTPEGVVVEDHTIDYVCTGCYADVRYTRSVFVHAQGGSELCPYTGVNGREQPGRPFDRSTAEWACRRRSYKLHPYPRPIPVRVDGRLDVETYRYELERMSAWRS